MWPCGGGGPKRFRTSGLEPYELKCFAQEHNASPHRVNVNPRTSARYVHKRGYYGRPARNKLLLRPANFKRRKDSLTGFEFGSGDCDQEFEVKILQPTMKRCSYSVMVRGAISSNGQSELVNCVGNINSDKYVYILRKGLLISSSDDMVKEGSLFMSSCHMAKKTRDWLEWNGIEKLPWPSQLHYMVPIKGLWSIMDKRLRKKNKEISNILQFYIKYHTFIKNIRQKAFPL
ncbi:uncharacterized protein LOC106869302 [Octopus bimaculoides]|uniref:uncharacterized protein LOC106869302 n=1 Tax=Octopus bimaculoides TaxID=37653 RepID=UPI00071CBFD2|nr:uncharacterized protein LOC106869302 [Octopus bimaculoides]|eukprot:XP_014770467.1 PREDICTED: uncharacterized protein LOC106869302 [Octopus bimaculoides]